MGDRAGDEIAEVYISMPESRIIRPRLELKGFKRVSLLPSESKRVTVPFNGRTFAFFDVKSNDWKTEAGEYDICVGASSEDIRLTATVSLEGILPEKQKEAFPSYAKGEIRNVPDEEYFRLLGRTVERDTGKKRRLPVTENSTVGDLRYARGWTGRFFSWAIRFVIGASKAFGNRGLANTMVMGTLHQPMRGLGKFGGMNRRQMEGLIKMFDGHFFKGLHQFLHKSKEEKAEIKAAKQKAKLEKKMQKEGKAAWVITRYKISKNS